MPRTTKTFRVFVSSTFSDMRTERRILQEDVFPRLRALCENKGASFQDVDLRWGVNEEAQLDQKTIDICLGEIARCQRLSPKPNFIILLGDKYGWQPIPARIPSSEMALIRDRLGEEEEAIIDQWYREDFNALPPEYVLQPREGDYLSYGVFAPLETRLRDILRKTAAQLPFTEAEKVKYFASATHQEILAGALEPAPGVIDPEEHVFAYLRTIRGLPEDETAKDYIDLSGNVRDVYSKEQLEKLKQDLKAKLPREHVYDYGARWESGCALDDAGAFGERVYDDLKSVIENQLGEIEEVGPLTKEIRQHQEFKKQRLEHFTGREEALQAIRDYLHGPTNKVFTIIGTSGSGKTSLMAKAVEEVENRKGILVFRFLGTTSATSNVYQLLSSLVREIASSYDIEMSTLLKEGEDETKFSTLRGLQETFLRCLNLATKEKLLFIFLDALDQLSRNYAALPLDWIPKEIPEHAKFVVSALPELREKLAHTVAYELDAMPVTEGEKLLERWLASVNRSVQPHQRQEIMQRFASNGTPLYLKLAFERVKGSHSYSADISLKADIDGVLREYFNELEKNHGSLLVQKFCGFLLSGKYQGLMEQEVLDLLVFDGEYWHYFLAHCHPDHWQEVQEMGKLPIVVWSRLFLDLEPYLSEREADGLPLISFYHRKFMDYVRATYLSDPLPYYRILAEHFEKLPLYLDEKEERPNIRKAAEQPYQETLSDKWSDITGKTLTHFPFLMAKAKANMVEGILEDYAFLWDRAPETVKEHLHLWRGFFTERAHILRRGNLEWPAYKILLQLAVEHADDSPVTIGAERWLEESRCDWPWLRRIQRVAHIGKSPCLAVLEGHTDRVAGALETKDGPILSWSADRTLRLWDREGKPLAVLEGHTDYWVRGALETKDGHILSWSEDHTLRLWDQKGKPLVVLEGHTDRVTGALETRDGNFLSWSDGLTLRLWGREGKPLAILEGHTLRVTGALETRDGRFLSWSWDRTLRLWGREGKPLSVLEGHTSWVNGALETRDGDILSWSCDHTLRLWDREGNPLSVLEGHTREITGALETREGHFLSWSSWENTLRLWDREGTPLAVLGGHTGSVEGALETRDGCFLSWSWDHTLRLWGREGKPLAILPGHTYSVEGAIETRDGQFLSWSSWDCILRLWDQKGKPLAILEGHTYTVAGAIETRNGQFLSWSWDQTLRLWGREGKPLSVLEGHTREVSDALETRDGRFLSWASVSPDEWLSKDRTLRLWDREGKPLSVLEGHTREITGALETKDGHFLSWSWDHTLRLWDHEGKPLAILEGHMSGVRGALETRDGHFLSWSSDRTLRVWDQMGRDLYSCTIDDGLRKFPEFRTAYSGRENNVSQSSFRVLGSFRVLANIGCLTTFNEGTVTNLFWHGESECKARHLKSDGLAVLTQANGQVCFLRIYHGNKPISVEELEKLHGEG